MKTIVLSTKTLRDETLEGLQPWYAVKYDVAIGEYVRYVDRVATSLGFELTLVPWELKAPFDFEVDSDKKVFDRSVQPFWSWYEANRRNLPC